MSNQYNAYYVAVELIKLQANLMPDSFKNPEDIERAFSSYVSLAKISDTFSREVMEKLIDPELVELIDNINY